MGTRHGKDGVIKVNGNAMKTTKWSIKEDVDTSDNSSQGDDSKTHLTGMKGWSGSITAWMNKSEATGQNVLAIGAEVSGDFYDDGTGAGQTYHSGTFTVTGITRTVDKGSTIEYQFDYLGQGALAHPTVGA